LLRGVAGTAAFAGTATAVSGRVQRRQAEKFADRDAQIYAEREQAYAQQTQAQQPVYQEPAQQAPPPPAAAPAEDDTVAKQQQLGELKAQGVLTDDEFAAAKAKVLGV
jgi:hypothetical protein